MSEAPSYLLGLTGSIGMGKSTTAAIFADLGIPVWDADETVHKLYSTGGSAVEPVTALCPSARDGDLIDRAALRGWVAEDPARLGPLMAIVHPLVAQDRATFIDTHSDPVLLFDIPLLYETDADDWLDAVAVVTVDVDVQRARVLARSDMTEEQLDMILAKQLPDTEKRERADFIIPTDTPDTAKKAVAEILAAIEHGHA